MGELYLSPFTCAGREGIKDVEKKGRRENRRLGKKGKVQKVGEGKERSIRKARRGREARERVMRATGGRERERMVRKRICPLLEKKCRRPFDRRAPNCNVSK